MQKPIAHTNYNLLLSVKLKAAQTKSRLLLQCQNKKAVEKCK